MNRSYNKIRHIQNTNLILERRYLNEGEKDEVIAKMGYSNIDAAFKAKKYVRNDNPELSRGLYQPIVQYVRDYGNNIKVVGSIFAPNEGGASIQLVNTDVPNDFPDCLGIEVKTYPMNKNITITNENAACVLNEIDKDIFGKNFLNRK